MTYAELEKPTTRLRRNIFRASFSNGQIRTADNKRRQYTHAWHATGYHRLTNVPWSFSGFSTSGRQAEKNMESMTNFAQPDRISFSEVVAVEVI